MSKITNLEKIIESALLVSQTPLSLQDIANLFEDDKPSKNQIKSV